MPTAASPIKRGLALLFTLAVVLIASLTSSRAHAASGYWQYVRTETSPSEAEFSAIKPTPGRIHEQHVSAAFQAKYAGKGSMELYFKADDVEFKLFITRGKFVFGTSSDLSVLIPGTNLRFEGSSTIESNFTGATAWGRMWVDNGDYLLQATASVGKDATGQGEFKVPSGGPGGELRINAALYLSTYGGMNATVTNVYRWVEGPAPPTAGASGAAGQPGLPGPAGGGSSGAFGGGWSTSEGDMNLNQNGAHVTGTYGSDNGRIDGQVQGGRVTGYWGEDGSAQQCATQRLGTYFWGRFEWVLAADGKTFEGRWSYCDAEPGSPWTGRRTGPAPTAGHTDIAPPVTGSIGGGDRGATTGGWRQSPTPAPDSHLGTAGQGGGASKPNDALGSRLDVIEGDWIGVWTRRGGTGVFDATWRNRSTGAHVSDVIRIESLSGSLVVFKRDGNGGRYFGAIGCDGHSVVGSASWYAAGVIWTATITRDVASSGSVSSGSGNHGEATGGSGAYHGDATAGSATGHHDQGVIAQPSGAQGGPALKLFDNWNTGGCAFTDTATLDLDRPIHLDRLDLWINWRAGERSVGYRVFLNGQDLGGGQLQRAECDPYQAAWCTGTDRPDAQLAPGHYIIRIDHAALCQNGGSGGAGFIRAWGRAG